MLFIYRFKKWRVGTYQDLGQMYVHYYDRELLNEGDNPPIGIVLCTDKSVNLTMKFTAPLCNCCRRGLNDV